MRRMLRPKSSPWVVLLALLALVPWGRSASSAACEDVAEEAGFEVLTVNLLFSEVATRDERLRDLARFAAENRVDVILLQEVAAGFLAKTSNSAADLQEILNFEHGIDYDLRTAFEAGRPNILAVANATLSRCAILRAHVEPLPAASEITIEGEVVPIPRNVLMTLLDLPGLGRASVYNTHLCAGCTPSERMGQIEALLQLVERMRLLEPADRATVLGGDFNINIFAGAEDWAIYDRILMSGFEDAYAASVSDPLQSLCEAPEAPDEHCTVGVSLLQNRLELSREVALGVDLPLLDRVSLEVPISAEIPLTEEEPAAERIDYIFVRNVPTVIGARVIFNPLVAPGQPAVSDHAGVLVKLDLLPR